MSLIMKIVISYALISAFRWLKGSITKEPGRLAYAVSTMVSGIAAFCML